MEHMIKKDMLKEKQRTECEVYSRVVGYLRPVNQWNKGKQQEFEDRIEYKLKESDNKMSEENIGIKGWLDWKLYDELGNLKQQGADHNQVQTALKRDIAYGLLKSQTTFSTASFFVNMGLGTGAVGVDTAVTMTNWCSGPPTIISGNTAAGAVATITATIPAGRQSGTIVSAGLFSTSTTTGLKCWAACGVTKAAGDSLALTWTITIA